MILPSGCSVSSAAKTAQVTPLPHVDRETQRCSLFLLLLLATVSFSKTRPSTPLLPRKLLQTSPGSLSQSTQLSIWFICSQFGCYIFLGFGGRILLLPSRAANPTWGTRSYLTTRQDEEQTEFLAIQKAANSVFHWPGMKLGYKNTTARTLQVGKKFFREIICFTSKLCFLFSQPPSPTPINFLF